MDRVSPDEPASTPLISVMVPTYEPGPFLRDALVSMQRSLGHAGVLAQVELIDDGSPTVDVEALVNRWVAEGAIAPLNVYRRSRNGGLGECWNSWIQRASGEYVHILHQDDLVAPEFYRRMLDTAKRFPASGMIFCRTIFLEGDGQRLDILEQTDAGVLDNWLEKICAGQRLQCPSVIVRAGVYDRLGGYDSDLRYIIDWEMWVRIAAFEPVAYVPAALAFYRMHAGAETQRIKASGVATLDAARGLKKIRQTLDRAGRMDCFPLVVRFCTAISAFAAYDAERAGLWRVSAKELMTGLRHFGGVMPLALLARQIRAYARARVKALGRSVAVGS